MTVRAFEWSAISYALSQALGHAGYAAVLRQMLLMREEQAGSIEQRAGVRDPGESHSWPGQHGDERPELRMLAPTWRIAELCIGQTARQVSVALNTSELYLCRGWEGGHVAPRALSLCADVFDMTTRAAILRVIEDRPYRSVYPV